MNTDEDKALEGKYANNFKIGYNAFEFLIDFGQVYENDKDTNFHTRIITNPMYIKELLAVLISSIQGYENKFGQLQERDE